ncbi:BON domain-containing protein [Salinibacterium sp.]|uniref:BON domain-containing protein n=1 Tax=Salinibacterium sp. TaxID=1915057 RepID=UPI00286BFAC6|nr:BON domain-containing protein [Salinibacterium sp.]
MTQIMNDVELKAAIVDELDWTPSVNSAQIGVAVSNGVVTLAGEVGSYPEKRDAERAALRVRGVTAVAEEITVRSIFADVGDVHIAHKASAALEQAVDVPPDQVKVEVHDHTITLSGHVAWQFQRAAAYRSVRFLKGVTDVVNAIIIQPAVSTDDVKDAISTAIVRSAQHEGDGITVVADGDGAVTLTGNVHSWAERRQSEHTAWSARGVTSVTNKLRVHN